MIPVTATQRNVMGMKTESAFTIRFLERQESWNRPTALVLLPWPGRTLADVLSFRDVGRCDQENRIVR